MHTATDFPYLLSTPRRGTFQVAAAGTQGASGALRRHGYQKGNQGVATWTQEDNGVNQVNRT